MSRCCLRSQLPTVCRQEGLGFGTELKRCPINNQWCILSREENSSGGSFDLYEFVALATWVELGRFGRYFSSSLFCLCLLSQMFQHQICIKVGLNYPAGFSTKYWSSKWRLGSTIPDSPLILISFSLKRLQTATTFFKMLLNSSHRQLESCSL